RVDAQCRADREHHVAALARPHGPIDDGRVERLAEADRVRLEDAAADEARRILLAGTYTVERLLHRPTIGALPASCPPGGAVHLDHLVGRVAGSLVQLVDVLGDDAVE